MDNRLNELKSYSHPFLSNLAGHYYRRLRGVTYVPNPTLTKAMDDMSRGLLPGPEGVLELEKLYKANQQSGNW